MNINNEISLDGFTVVSGDYFTYLSRSTAPTLSIWPDSIRFSRQDILMLNKCDNIVMRINYQERRIIVTPAKSTDKDALKWIGKTDPLDARKIKCSRFTNELYESWGWDKNTAFRTTGHLVTANNKVMILFDFSYPEQWRLKVATNGK